MTRQPGRSPRPAADAPAPGVAPPGAGAPSRLLALAARWDEDAADAARAAALLADVDRAAACLGRGRARQLEECAADLRNLINDLEAQ